MTVNLGTIAWPALEGLRAIVVVPVGSCEQHGPHLPLATDTIIAEQLCKSIDNVVVAPSVAIAASGEHAGFPGTLSIGNEALTRVLIELGRSADWSATTVSCDTPDRAESSATASPAALACAASPSAAVAARVIAPAAGASETVRPLILSVVLGTA
jgi:creatinine amidohydrolase